LRLFFGRRRDGWRLRGPRHERSFPPLLKNDGRWVSVIRILFGMVLLAQALSAFAARLSPPLEALRKSTNGIVVATVQSIRLDPAAIEIKVEKRLQGLKRERLFVRVDPFVLPRIEVGGRYVLVYAAHITDRAKPGRMIDLAEPILLTTDGAAPAMFRDEAQALTLLAPSHAEVEKAPSYRAWLVSQLSADDPSMRDLAAAELVLHPGLAEALTSKEALSVLAAIVDEVSLPSTRARLFGAAAQQRIALTPEQLRAPANAILMTLPVISTEDMFNPETLASVVLSFAQTHPELIDARALPRWLRSARAALVEQAALVIRAQAPDKELAAINLALADSWLPASTRGFLQDHLRRLHIMRKAQP